MTVIFRITAFFVPFGIRIFPNWREIFSGKFQFLNESVMITVILRGGSPPFFLWEKNDHKNDLKKVGCFNEFTVS